MVHTLVAPLLCSVFLENCTSTCCKDGIFPHSSVTFKVLISDMDVLLIPETSCFTTSICEGSRGAAVPPSISGTEGVVTVTVIFPVAFGSCGFSFKSCCFLFESFRPCGFPFKSCVFPFEPWDETGSVFVGGSLGI